MYGKLQESGLTEIIPLTGTSAYLCFLILSLLNVHWEGPLQELTARWRAHSASNLSSLRACCQDGCKAVT